MLSADCDTFGLTGGAKVLGSSLYSTKPPTIGSPLTSGGTVGSHGPRPVCR
jgi:hypothetical protein